MNKVFITPENESASRGAVTCQTGRRVYIRVGLTAAFLPPTPICRATAPLLIVCFYLSIDWLLNSKILIDSFRDALYLAGWYAQEDVLLCLLPAFIQPARFRFSSMGVMSTQAVAIKGMVVLSGKSSSAESIKTILENLQ